MTRSAGSDGSLPPPPTKESPIVNAAAVIETAKSDEAFFNSQTGRVDRISSRQTGGGELKRQDNHRSSEPRSWLMQSSRSGDEVETMHITDDDASFILGAGGRTKRKLARVCGAELNVTELGGRTVLEIRGSDKCRERAKLYVDYVMQQRIGPVKLEYTAADRDDLTCIEVPHECVGYVTGRRGHGLRCIEEEWCTLMFFTDLRSNKVGETEKLAIFGDDARARRGAELKVMSAVEQKLPGHFTKNVGEHISKGHGFDTDMTMISDEDYSYALGKEGSTRKKLARASGAILEYVGRVAFIAGTKSQRTRAREYLEWLCAQRTSFVSVITDNRTDCTVVSVPTACVAYVTGTKGHALRRIEELTGTFIFLDGTRGEESERLLIFGEDDAGRQRAKQLVSERIDDKVSGRSRYIGRGGAYSDYRSHCRGRSRSYGRMSRSRSPRGGHQSSRRWYAPEDSYEERRDVYGDRGRHDRRRPTSSWNDRHFRDNGYQRRRDSRRSPSRGRSQSLPRTG